MANSHDDSSGSSVPATVSRHAPRSKSWHAHRSKSRPREEYHWKYPETDRRWNRHVAHGNAPVGGEWWYSRQSEENVGVQNRGKGKGKGKSKTKRTPETLGFTKSDRSQHLFTRPAALPGACRHAETSCLEIGNLKGRNEDSFCSAQHGIATLEVLCDTNTIFGNPFDRKTFDETKQRKSTDESYRDRLVDAYQDYLCNLVDPAPENEDCTTLTQMARRMCSRHSLDFNDIRYSWKDECGKIRIEEFRSALDELTDLVRCRDSADAPQTPGDKMTRLVCWCAPLRCHVEALADHINKRIDTQALQCCMSKADEEVSSISSVRWLNDGSRSQNGASAWIAAASDDRNIGHRTTESLQSPTPPPPPSIPRPLPVAREENELAARLETWSSEVAAIQEEVQQRTPSTPPRSRWDPLGCNTRRASSRAASKNGRRKPPWGDYWGAAGIVALRAQGTSMHTCLVEKRNGRLGFPKGRAEHPDASALVTAYREWSEESMLSSEHLCVWDGHDPFVDAWGCHYFFADWNGSENALELGETQTWQVQDDPNDDDPIVCAHWMPCSKALSNEMLSLDRKQILRQALRGLHLMENSRSKCISNTASNDSDINASAVKKNKAYRWRNKIMLPDP